MSSHKVIDTNRDISIFSERFSATVIVSVVVGAISPHERPLKPAAHRQTAMFVFGSTHSPLFSQSGLHNPARQNVNFQESKTRTASAKLWWNLTIGFTGSLAKSANWPIGHTCTIYISSAGLVISATKTTDVLL